MTPVPCPEDSHLCKERLLALKDTLELVSGEWKFCVLLICLLLNFYNHGAMRFTDLQHAALGITPKELQELEEHLLVTRTVNTTKLVTVLYALTEHAINTQPAINVLIDFGLKHRQKIKTGR
jgi:DNA-binding HxlR family transcriptional regulator